MRRGLFEVNCPCTRYRPRRRRRGFNWVRFLTFLGLVAVLIWVMTGRARAADVSYAEQAGSLSHELVSPWLSGGMIGLLVASVVALVWLAVRKQQENEAFFARLRNRSRIECDETGEPIWPTREEIEKRKRFEADRSVRAPIEDVFEPLRAPGERLPDDDVQRILVACAAEARCIAKHVKRAQRTLSVEDYGDELSVAEAKLDGVIRCVEALVERLCADLDQTKKSETEISDLCPWPEPVAKKVVKLKEVAS